MLKAFDHEQENFFWHSNLSSKNERNTAIQDSERWMSFNSAYINMALLSKIRTYIKKFYVKIIHYSHSMGIGFHVNLVKSMQNVLKKSLRGSKKKKKEKAKIHSVFTALLQELSRMSGYIPFSRSFLAFHFVVWLRTAWLSLVSLQAEPLILAYPLTLGEGDWLYHSVEFWVEMELWKLSFCCNVIGIWYETLWMLQRAKKNDCEISKGNAGQKK